MERLRLRGRQRTVVLESQRETKPLIVQFVGAVLASAALSCATYLGFHFAVQDPLFFFIYYNGVFAAWRLFLVILGSVLLKLADERHYGFIAAWIVIFCITSHFAYVGIWGSLNTIICVNIGPFIKCVIGVFVFVNTMGQIFEVRLAWRLVVKFNSLGEGSALPPNLIPTESGEVATSAPIPGSLASNKELQNVTLLGMKPLNNID